MKNSKNKVEQEMTLYSLLVASLKGVSQVIFIENAISGIIILIAITIANYSIGFIAIISSIIGTLTARFGKADIALINQGLFGYNSVLIGIALSIYRAGNISWEIAFAGAILAAILTATMMHLFKNIQIPVLTAPYIILTWIFLLASYHFKTLTIAPELTPQNLSGWKLAIGGNLNFTNGIVNGVGQVYFQDTFWSALLIIVAVFWANWKWGVYAILGSIIGWATAYALQPEYELLNLGLYGYNAVLTILAVATVFDEDRSFTLITGIIAASVSVVITACVHSIALPYGLPVLTMPFVITAWIFLGTKEVLPRV